MRTREEEVNQIIAELMAFCCWRCMHSEDEAVCKDCYMHEFDRRLREADVDVADTFDKRLARRHAKQWKGGK